MQDHYIHYRENSEHTDPEKAREFVHAQTAQDIQQNFATLYPALFGSVEDMNHKIDQRIAQEQENQNE